MSRSRRPSRSLQPQSPAVASDARGIAALDVDRAADSLLRAGERPTVAKVRTRIGRGSPNTINPLLDAWWRRLAGRLDAGPAALHRLPEPVLLAAEGLWLQALDDARRRAAAEQGSRKSSLAKDRQELEIRSHVLSIREQEIGDRLKQSESRVARLELELEALTTMLRKEQASRASVERRLHELVDYATVRRGRATNRLLKIPIQQPVTGPRTARRNQARSQVRDFGNAAKVAPFASDVEKRRDSVFQHATKPTAATPGKRATRKPKPRKPARRPTRTRPIRRAKVSTKSRSRPR